MHVQDLTLLLRRHRDCEVSIIGDRPLGTPPCPADNLVKTERGSREDERKPGVLDADGDIRALLFEGDEVPEAEEGRETWTLVQNPNPSDVQVDITYMTPNGQGNVTKTETIPASSRKTFNMAEHSGINGRAAIMVNCKTAGQKIMVERAMYWNNRGAGTDTIGGYVD